MKSILITFLSFLLLVTCKPDREKRIEDAADKIEEAAEKMAEAAEKMGEEIAGQMEHNADEMTESMENITEKMGRDSNVKAVDFSVLKNLLPAELAGLKKQHSIGEQGKRMGFEISYAEAEYYKDNDRSRIVAEITDMGNMSGFMEMGAAAWAMTDFENEDNNGFERTTRINGHKAFEEYDNNLQRGKVSIIVAGRFMVELRSRRLSYKLLRDAAEQIDFSGLVGLAEDTMIY